MTTIADNLRDAAQSRGLDIKCKMTPVFRQVRIDVENWTRVIRESTAARILLALRAGAENPVEILRTMK